MNAFFILKTHTTCFSFQYKWPNEHLTMKIRVANEIIRHALSRKPLWVNNIYLLIRIKVEKTIPALWTSRVRCLTRKLRPAIGVVKLLFQLHWREDYFGHHEMRTTTDATQLQTDATFASATATSTSTTMLIITYDASSTPKKRRRRLTRVTF